MKDREFRMFIELLYSLAKQYVGWYEREIKDKEVQSKVK